MAEPFKNLINAGLVRAAAGHLQHHGGRDFDAKRFTAMSCAGLEALEMKARAMQIADALQATLPADFHRAAALIEAALAPPHGTQTLADSGDLGQGLRGWILWPVGEFIARRGIAKPERALAALHAITQRFTAEFAIRPLIVAHPELVFATLRRWCEDDSEHVRRLVSEGSRPRLPWGLRLQTLVADPTPTLPLLLALQDDTSDYVRRSVANHLNDIAKDHPALVADWLERHLPGASAERSALLRHAARSLIKQGDLRALRAFGLGVALRGQAVLELTPARVAVGEALRLSLRLRSTATRPQTLAIDYAVHHLKANGTRSAKVFKGWKLELAPRAEVVLVKRHSMKAVTTRRYHPGRHGLSVQVNGRTLAQAEFELLP
jgi:3-methyladenine DNA glycosylase AlkC